MTFNFPRSLTLAFGVVQALAAAVAVFAMVGLHASSRTAQELIEKEANDLVAVERLRATMERQVASLRGYLLSGDSGLLGEHAAAVGQVGRALEGLRRTSSPAGKEFLRRFEQLAKEHNAIVAAVLPSEVPAGPPPSARRDFESKVLPSFWRVDEALTAYAEHQRAAYAAALREATSDARASLAGVAGVVALGLLLGGWLAASFGRKLGAAFEAEREAKRIAEAAVGARQDLLGTVAHDLRNPLSAITLKSELIVRGLPEGARLREHARSLQRVAGRMQFLIGSLLDAASLEAGGLQLNLQRCPAGSLLEGARELFEAQAAERGVGLEVRLPEKPLTLLGDRERLLQVLSNLVGNALKFTPPGGCIRLGCERVGERVVFEVADSGPGIRPEDLPHLFDRYWKRDVVSSRRGTGLGLYIVRGIVERHGGRAWVESEPGRGATFLFEVPLEPGMPGPALELARA